jgi:hypothetical protein
MFLYSHEKCSSAHFCRSLSSSRNLIPLQPVQLRSWTSAHCCRLKAEGWRLKAELWQQEFKQFYNRPKHRVIYKMFLYIHENALRITGFLDFAHRLGFWVLENKCFGSCICFHPQKRGRNLLSWIHEERVTAVTTVGHRRQKYLYYAVKLQLRTLLQTVRRHQEQNQLYKLHTRTVSFKMFLCSEKNIDEIVPCLQLHKFLQIFQQLLFRIWSF